MSETRASWWARRIGSPAALLAKGGTTKPVLVCVGDSITAGDLSAHWVRLLRQRPDLLDVEVVNAGVNSDLAWNVLQRLDEVSPAART